MSQNISLEEIKKFWPKDAPNIDNVQKYVSKYQKEKIVIKYGGNVLIDRTVFNNFILDINILNLGIPDKIISHGSQDELYSEIGLDKKSLEIKINELYNHITKNEKVIK